jgi:hypothetical protein
MGLNRSLQHLRFFPVPYGDTVVIRGLLIDRPGGCGDFSQAIADARDRMSKTSKK